MKTRSYTVLLTISLLISCSSQQEKNKALFHACESGNLKTVIYNVKHGANVNAHFDNGFTPLLTAVFNNHKDVVEFLLTTVADLYEQDSLGESVLMVAVENENEQIIRTLLSHKAGISGSDKQGNTALMRAAFKGSVSIMKLLITFGANINEKSTENRSTVLSLISADTVMPNVERCNIVAFLLSKGANINAKDELNRTPLMWACENGDTDVVDILLKNKAIINPDSVLLEGESNASLSALGIAIKANHLNVVRRLVDNGADINGKVEHRMSALKLASNFELIDIVKYLISKKANVNGEIQKDYGTALTGAAISENVNLIRILLENGANPNVFENGATPLMWVIDSGNIEAVKLLLKYGANPKLKANGRDAIIEAQIDKRDSILRLLKGI